ncbi:MAG: DNA repair protein RadC [Paracoccaceae bacterium]
MRRRADTGRSPDLFSAAAPPEAPDGFAYAPEAPAGAASAPNPAERSVNAPGKAPERSANADPIDDRHGHRDRLRERFMKAGEGALADYEMLELVLFRAIPRKDVKPLAKRLMRVFGDFNHVVAAPPARLAEVEEMTPAAVRELKVVEAAAHRFAQAKVLGRNAIQSWDQLVAYCVTRLAHEGTEQFRILFLDRKNVLIADEAQQRGTVDHVPVYPREVVKRALELGASALVLVHNHPSGDPQPSRADVDMTRRIEAACRAVGLALHDHVVIGKGEVASFHALGLLDE